MVELEIKKNDLPQSFTQTKSDVVVIELAHVNGTNESSETILRVQDRLEVGSLSPITLVLRPLGSPFYYQVETYEITTHGCIIYSDDNEGRQVSLKPGSSLVDALIVLPLPQAQNIHFIGKVTDRISLENAMHDETAESSKERFGYAIRFSQISHSDQETLRAYLKNHQKH